jgi:hypothetical protein
MAMSAEERSEIQSRLGRFAEMSEAEVLAWMEREETERRAAALAECGRNGAHIYMWSSRDCILCGTPYDDE